MQTSKNQASKQMGYIALIDAVSRCVNRMTFGSHLTVPICSICTTQARGFDDCQAGP